MAGGAIMISDMFNNALKARVNALCNELSALIRSEPAFVSRGSFQSSKSGRESGTSQTSIIKPSRDVRGLTERLGGHLPTDLGVPSSLGAQNDVRYAYFPATRPSPSISTGK